MRLWPRRCRADFTSGTRRRLGWGRQAFRRSRRLPVGVSMRSGRRSHRRTDSRRDRNTYNDRRVSPEVWRTHRQGVSKVAPMRTRPVSPLLRAILPTRWEAVEICSRCVSSCVQVRRSRCRAASATWQHPRLALGERATERAIGAVIQRNVTAGYRAM